MRTQTTVALVLYTAILAAIGPFTTFRAAAATTTPIAITASVDHNAELPASIPHTPTWRVVYFWSSVCPCVRACERYSMIPLALKYRGRITFYAIASNEYDLGMPHKELLNLLAQHHLPFAAIIDNGHTIAKYLNAKITPQTFVLDPAGNVVFDGMPDDSRRFLFDPPTPVKGKPPVVPSSYLATALAEGLAGKAVTETPLKEAGCSIDW